MLILLRKMMKSVVRMKSKIIYLLTALAVVLASITLYRIDVKTTRIHQHLDSRYQDQTTSDDQYYLPIITIDTNNQTIPGSPLGNGNYELSTTGEDFIIGDFTLIDNQSGNNQLSDQAAVNSKIKVGYRGNSSRHFDKKSYSLHLIDQDGKENKQELAGMSSHSEWVLNGPFLDRTYLRNYLCMNIAGEIMEYAPNVRFCELFIDGKYQGLYLLMETITRGEGRIEINKTDENADLTSFIVRWDRQGKGDHEIDNFTYYTYQSDISALDIRYPGKNTITDGKADYINNQISQIEKMLYSASLYEESYNDLIDINSFAQYFIINEFFRNVDAGWFSTFYYKDVRGKVKTVVWDFNNACDNYAQTINNEIGFSMHNAPWFNQLIKDEEFVSLVISQYHRLRKSVLATDYLLEYIEATDKWLTKAIKRNDQIWGYVYDLNNYNPDNYLIPQDRNFTSHGEAIEELKEFIVKRGKWLDEHIDSLYQYCAESKNANELLR